MNYLARFLFLLIIIYVVIFKGIAKYYHEKNEEVKSKMHDILFNETIPFYLDRFEKIVTENGGYFVNGKVWAYYYIGTYF